MKVSLNKKNKKVGALMKIIEKQIQVNDYVTKSNLPASDYVINPYVGCPHGCKYCYASFMKRFTGHKEDWGTFIDIKQCNKKINVNKLKNKRVFLSSVTDCYNQFEEKYELTRSILKQLVDVNCELSISTKSKLILRDLDLLKQMKNLTVSMSINTLDENFKNDMDNASSIQERLYTLKELHNNGIYTVLFMSPIFPYITNVKEIIDVSKEYIYEYWFENLNLRGSYKQTILNYIKSNYPELVNYYDEIYNKKPLNELGLEPWDSNLNEGYLKEKYKKIKKPIKEVLLDQSIIVGIGNIYADEILFLSKINPYKKPNELTNEELKNIIINTRHVLEAAIKKGGTTIRTYTSSEGVHGRFQQDLLVHSQKECKTCNSPLKIEKIGGRTTYYCPKCQK